MLHVQTQLRKRAVNQIEDQRHKEVVREQKKLRGALIKVTSFEKDEAANKAKYAQRMKPGEIGVRAARRQRSAST